MKKVWYNILFDADFNAVTTDGLRGMVTIDHAQDMANREAFKNRPLSAGYTARYHPEEYDRIMGELDDHDCGTPMGDGCEICTSMYEKQEAEAWKDHA